MARSFNRQISGIGRDTGNVGDHIQRRCPPELCVDDLTAQGSSLKRQLCDFLRLVVSDLGGPTKVATVMPPLPYWQRTVCVSVCVCVCFFVAD